MPSAFHFDPNRCTGCQACELACSIENDLGPDRSWREVVTFNDASAPGIPRFHLSLACNHCSEPACLLGCPAAAYRKDGEQLAEWIRKSINYSDNDIGDPVMDPLFDVALEDPQWKNLMQALGKSPAQLDSVEFDVVIPDSQVAGAT